MNRRTRSKRHTELLADKWNQIEWMTLPSKVKGVFTSLPLPKWHRRALMVLVPVTIILIMMPTPKSSTEVKVATPTDARVSVPINTRGLSEQRTSSTTTSHVVVSGEVPAKGLWIDYKVKAGDTLANVFRANNLSMTDLNALAKIEGIDKPLSQIKQGQLVRFKRDDEGRLDILQLERDNDSVMFFRLSNGGFGRSK
ncbi:lysine transporter LysM [Vibrio sp. UCD-FRSSP16_10]|uniref:LysM-like peptidoglycan-binding domain-containing protein n=1 Tax=unclassified Vibrio TaxID=2614977 RepID=UPI000801210D|nr:MULTISPECIES: LysM-like peptidoglycan-binding domain-containing protein [unclassified Vibrio]OBT16736.1 lysine transporter LysM [Vibrio sp. UCD-FRSSP16_30]OBT21363.1 lysine transporter LysM [Vibrio sp. UCD-FRSSP16_10]